MKKQRGAISISTVIGALLTVLVGMFAIVITQAEVQPLTNPDAAATAAAAATVAAIPPGTPLQPVNITPWVIVEAIILCGLVIAWYFYHHLPRKKVKSD